MLNACMRILISLLLMGLAAAAAAQDKSTSVGGRRREDARIGRAPARRAARKAARRPCGRSTTATALDWHYTPRSRNGVALKELDARGRDAVHALLRTALSAAGYRKVVNIIELELVLREIETFGLMRDPGALSPHGLRHARPRRGAGAGASRAITCRSISRSPATRWPSTRRASSAPTRRRCRKGRRRACACCGEEDDAGWRAARVARATRSAARRCSTRAPTATS